ncbi:hypothetical protein JZO67_005164 [Enterococcus sp. 665A]|uniref:Uncharacterized protein n=1 Tax=Candidatus Enterococcus ferrettii TaxID=2815324 RepID=A0ABV0EZ76_9ENTE
MLTIIYLIIRTRDLLILNTISIGRMLEIFFVDNRGIYYAVKVLMIRCNFILRLLIRINDSPILSWSVLVVLVIVYCLQSYFLGPDFFKVYLFYIESSDCIIRWKNKQIILLTKKDEVQL